VVLTDYESFSDYYGSGTARGRDLEGREVEVRPEPADIDVHNSCYWFNARISRYFTVENRISDQQPADDLMAPAAFSLGLATSLDEAWEEVAARDWAGLRRQRDEACRAGLATDDEQLIGLCEKALELADQGLRLRGLGEERFLAPMYQRLGVRENPGQQVRAIFEEGGIQGLLEARNLAAPELSLQS
jgi:gamma-glutamylcysteine synthetase